MSEVYEGGNVTMPADTYRALLTRVHELETSLAASRQLADAYADAARFPGTDRGGTSVATQLVHCQHKREELEAEIERRQRWATTGRWA